MKIKSRSNLIPLTKSRDRFGIELREGKPQKKIKQESPRQITQGQYLPVQTSLFIGICFKCRRKIVILFMRRTKNGERMQLECAWLVYALRWASQQRDEKEMRRLHASFPRCIMQRPLLNIPLSSPFFQTQPPANGNSQLFFLFFFFAFVLLFYNYFSPPITSII